MMKGIFLIAAVPILVAASPVISADEWPWPHPQVFGSTGGSFGLKTMPPQPPVEGRTADVGGNAPPMSFQTAMSTGRSQAVLFQPTVTGTDSVLWRRQLVNIPYRAVISGDGKYVVTFDTWGRVGYAHALVIYGAQGRLVADLALEAVLTPSDISKVPISKSSRWWLEGAAIAFNDAQDQLIITLASGKVVQVVLATGAIGR